MKGITAVFSSEVVNDEEEKEKVMNGEYSVIFFSPEGLLLNMEWREMLQSPLFQERLVAFVIDEAHCVRTWGSDFRREFSNLGEVRSLIPEDVHIMALTATATISNRQFICKVLDMRRPHVVSESPNKPNIKYSVRKKEMDIEETFAPLVEEIRKYRTLIDRVIIFCRKYDDVSHIYYFLKSRLGDDAFEPVGSPNLAKYRIVDMFSACTTVKVKETIIKSFSKAVSPLRVVVATVAFGMGLDCSNIRRVIHWGPPKDIESYLQETGRAGRDGKSSNALLYYGGNDFKFDAVEDNMKFYCKNKDKCRRQLLLKDFDPVEVPLVSDCNCCDVCASSCVCSKCV